jgi:predicted O-methyltransferase YrrM
MWRTAKETVNLLKTGRELSITIPIAPLSNIFSDIEKTPINLVDYVYNNGNMPINEMHILCQVICQLSPRTIFEIGTFDGCTTLQMAVNAPQAKIYTLDLPPNKDHKVIDLELDVFPVDVGCKYNSYKEASQITHQLLGDSQQFDFTPYSGKMDLVFVDACHHYEFVKKDSENALKMVSPDGIILWHDCADYAPGVVQALNELSAKKQLFHLQGTSLVIYHNTVRNIKK